MRFRFCIAAWVIPLAALGHPGNGIVALSSRCALTGDAVHNGIWRFEEGRAPVRLTGKTRFHCHWVAKGLDGRLYAETLSQRGGRWMQTVYQLDANGANPAEIASAEEGRFGIFAVDRDGGIITQTSTGVQVFRSGKWRPFRGSGKPAMGEPVLGSVRAMAWGPDDRLFVADGPHVRVADRTGVLKVVWKASGRVTAPLYAERGGPAVWGLAVDGKGQIIAAVPAFGRVVRIDAAGKTTTIAETREDWAATGVAVFGESVMLLETRTRGNVNEGPLVRAFRMTGKIVQLGSVGSQN